MSSADHKEMPHVVVVGAGFAGLSAAKKLCRAPVRLTVLDQQNYHLFQPLLYQVATAALSATDIAMPIRAILRRCSNVEVLLSKVTGFDLENRLVLRENEHPVPYDYLIVATGARHAYFGHPEWEVIAPGIKSLDDATEIRRRVLLAFEYAEKEEDPETRNAFMTMVIVGGGPTGIELAGALAELSRYTLTRDFRRIYPSRTKIILVEAGPRVLSSFPEELSAKATAALEQLGVHIILNQPVTGVTHEGVFLKDTFLRAKTVIWAAGVQASPLGHDLTTDRDRSGRVRVSPDLSLPDHPEVFVIGDLASITDAKGKQVPGVAPAAIQAGKFAAENILRLLEGKKTQAFVYRDKGNLAVIGRAVAVADFGGRLRLNGYLAWVLWAVVHIAYLIGFRSRFVVLMEWAWSYFTFKRGARLVFGASKLPVSIPARAPAPKPSLDGSQRPRQSMELQGELRGKDRRG